MAKIISIPNDNDPVMNSERQRIAPWAPAHGWIYTGYNDQGDHIAQIRRVGGGGPLEILDLDCHGAPTIFDHTPISSALTWAQELSRSTGFSANTAIYLDACNTGLTSAYGGPIAQVVANGARCRVYGTKGYMTGTYAEGNERCYASVSGYPPYPGAQDASGRNVWIAFGPQTGLKQLTMSELRSLSIIYNQRETAELASAIENILEGQPTEFPNLRMAPDITLNYTRANSVLILDVYANGGLIKDRISGLSWRVSNPERLQTLVQNHLSQ
jgi:hypothetical protein